MNMQDFKKCIKTLEKISFDNANKIYLSRSSCKAICFDDVADCYRKTALGSTTMKAKSFDALFFVHDKYLLIEFKNEKIKSGTKDKDRRLKISEGLLVFNDIFNKNISFDRKNVNYILVYGKQKNKHIEKRKREMEEATKCRANIAGEPFFYENFDFYKLFFNKVATMNENEFEKFANDMKYGFKLSNFPPAK